MSSPKPEEKPHDELAGIEQPEGDDINDEVRPHRRCFRAQPSSTG